jgi:hypothetical protein
VSDTRTPSEKPARPRGPGHLTQSRRVLTQPGP